MDGHYKNKIIYLSMLPFNSYIKNNFYYDALSRIYDIEFWDVSELTKYSSQKNKFNFDKLKSKINRYKKNIFVCLLTYDLNNYKIHRILCETNCYLVYFNWGHQPIKYKIKIFDFIKNFNLSYIKRYTYDKINFIIYKFSFYVGLLKKPDLEFIAGNFINNLKGKNKKIKINLHDNDFFLKSKKQVKKKISKNKNFFLFIDNNMSDHEDGSYLHGKKIFNFLLYQKNLESFFKYIENKFKTKVIIAPYYKYTRDYQKFLKSRFSKKHISELARDASTVMLHHTTAISYPVLNYKPIIFLTNNQIENSEITNYSNEIQALSTFFKSKVINTDKCKNINIPKVNKLIYDKYIDLFVGSKETITKYNKHIIINAIQNEIKKKN